MSLGRLFLKTARQSSVLRCLCSRSFFVSSSRNAEFQPVDETESIFTDESHGHLSDTEDSFTSEDEIKKRLLYASLDFVSEYGWTKSAIIEGAKSIDLSPSVHALFPKGGADLITSFYLDCNEQLSERMEQEVISQKESGVEKVKITPFIRDAILVRLSMNAPYMDRWAEAIGIMALPQNAPTGWRNLYNLVDSMWYNVGDKSLDTSWYTKRLSLAVIYKSTEIVMCADESEDFADTEEFLDSRLEDLTDFGKLMKSISDGQSNIAGNVMDVASLATNLLGLNARQR